MANTNVSRDGSGCANHPVVVLLGVLASIATIASLIIVLFPVIFPQQTPTPNHGGSPGVQTVIPTIIPATKIPPTPPDPTKAPPTKTPPPAATATPPPTPTFLERVSGNYRLVRWIEAPGPITIGMRVTTGTLKIDTTGDAQWAITIQEAGKTVKPEPGMKCKGRVELANPQLEGVPGTPGNEQINWTGNMSSIADAMWLTFCGWYVDGRRANFTLTLSGNLLEMKNSRGTYTWTR